GYQQSLELVGLHEHRFRAKLDTPARGPIAAGAGVLTRRVGNDRGVWPLLRLGSAAPAALRTVRPSPTENSGSRVVGCGRRPRNEPPHRPNYSLETSARSPWSCMNRCTIHYRPQ